MCFLICIIGFQFSLKISFLLFFNLFASCVLLCLLINMIVKFFFFISAVCFACMYRFVAVFPFCMCTINLVCLYFVVVRTFVYRVDARKQQQQQRAERLPFVIRC